jgi:hypothetical protein
MMDEWFWDFVVDAVVELWRAGFRVNNGQHSGDCERMTYVRCYYNAADDFPVARME